MAEPDEEQVEYRLLTDRAFCEEFDMMVDEISTLYVTGKFEGKEKQHVEEYFLKSEDRRNKARIICELVRQANLAREKKAAEIVPVNVVEDDKPTFFERVRLFWKSQSFSLRMATAVATIVILGGLLWSLDSRRSSAPTYMSFELSPTIAERSVGSEPKNEIKKVKLTDELRIKLTLPSQTPPARSFRAELRGEKVSLRQLSVLQQDATSITVVVSARQLTPGTYVIQLYAVNDSGAEQPVRAAYLFAVE